jgi:hypothetical protein
MPQRVRHRVPMPTLRRFPLPGGEGARELNGLLPYEKKVDVVEDVA